MTNRALRIGMLGTGTIAGVHARNLDQVPEARLVAVADINSERARELAGSRSAAVVPDLDGLLRYGLDAVIVCLPPFATAGVVARIAGAGVHLYAEKPVGLSLEAALHDLDAVRSAGVVAASGYMWRSSPLVRKACELLNGRAVGLVQGAVITGAPPPVWWRDKTLSGGALVELGTHIIDLMRLFGGEPRRVTCVGARKLLESAGCSVEDVSAATVEFQSGGVGSFSLSCATSGGRWSMDVVASNLHLHLNFFPEEMSGNCDGVAISHIAEATANIVPHGFSGAASWYWSLHKFVSAARAGDPNGVGARFEEGVRTLALTLALEESLAAGGMPVNVEQIK